MGPVPLMHPLQFLLLLLVCIVLMAVAGLRLVAMYSEGTISLLEVTIYAVLVLAALGSLLARWGTLWSVLYGLAFVALCLGPPLLQRIADRRLGERLLHEDLAECHRILQFDPQNAAAYSRLGDIYLRLGDLDTAVAQYQWAAQLSPQDKIVQQALQRAIERKRRADVPSRFCPRCRTENPSTAVYCRQCQTALSGWAELRHGLQQMTPAQWLKWTAVVAGLCLVLASAGVILPRTAAVLVGVFLAFAGALYLYIRPPQ